MDVIYWLLPAMLVVGLLVAVFLVWALKSGQYDDLEGPAHRILTDDEPRDVDDGNRKS